jgi:hypothetical protein
VAESSKSPISSIQFAAGKLVVKLVKAVRATAQVRSQFIVIGGPNLALNCWMIARVGGRSVGDDYGRERTYRAHPNAALVGGLRNYSSIAFHRAFDVADMDERIRRPEANVTSKKAP